MAKSIKYKNDIYLDSTGIVHKKEKLSNILTLNNNFLKFVKLSKNITISANGTISVTIASLPTISGYTYFGIIALQNGYADQWLVSYSEYGGNVVAMVHSNYGYQLSGDLNCVLIYVKNDYLAKNKEEK